MQNISLVIVIPCYNEYDRFPLREYEEFLVSHPDTQLCIVDDASTDRTAEILKELERKFKEQIILLKNDRNSGKAASVRNGVRYCHKESAAPAIAYLDADLATSLEECYSYLTLLEQKDFVFASRILKVGSVVERHFSRFLIGRIIATVISTILQIRVYDTQCGCKVFKTSMVPILFDAEFISKWLFDVELFSRILIHYGAEEGLAKMEEIPVKRWIDRGASKVKLTYFFRLGYDLYQINHAHKKGIKARQKEAL
jgi:glycosyltransferase involved in cell wall biosynthesis